MFSLSEYLNTYQICTFQYKVNIFYKKLHYLKKNYNINIFLWITQNMIIEPKNTYPKFVLFKITCYISIQIMIKLIIIMSNMNLLSSPLEDEQLLLNKDMEKSEINTQK